MIHSQMNEFELIRTRILPLPKKAEQLADKPVEQMDLPALEALWRQAKTFE